MKTHRLSVLATLAISLLGILHVAQAEQGALREVWTNVSGTKISSLESFEAYPDEPVISEIISSLQTPTNWGSLYGQRIRTLLKPTTTGDYTFWISGDDGAELWLGANDSPDSSVRIAQVTGWTGPEEWNKEEGQKSAVIPLVGGQSYYLEVLHKEHSGGDSVAVAWALDGGEPSIIGGSYLTAVGEAKSVATSGLWVEAGASKELYVPALGLPLGGQVLDKSDVRGSFVVQWSVTSGSGVVIDAPEELASHVTFPGPGVYELALTVTKGDLSETDSITVTVHPALDPEAGKATQQFWFDVRGTAVADLQNHLDFPRYPHMTREVEALQGPTSFHYYYGTRTVGYLLAPRTGNYQFYVSGDDSAQFSLSTDALPENVRLVAETTVISAPGDFFVEPEKQISEPILLTKGQRYYFELLHKENGSSDHHAVYWAAEGDDAVRLVTGEYLAPAMAVDPEVPTAEMDADFIVSAGRDQELYLPDRSTELTGGAIKRRWNAELVSQQWSVVNGPDGVAFSQPTELNTFVTFPGAGAYTLRLEVVSDAQTKVDEMQVDVRSALAEGAGLLTREVWFNRSFSSLIDLQTSDEYPHSPHIVDSLPSLRGPVNWSSKYGTRVTGWLHVPRSGDYTFYITGDDEAEFRIGADASEGSLELACRVPSATRATNWFDHPEQKSSAFTLEAGKRYAVELLHRELWGNDHFQVAWTVGDDRRPEPIEGSYFTPAKDVPEFREEVTYYAYAGVDRSYYWPHDETYLTGSTQKVRSSEAPMTTIWQQVSGPAATIANAESLDASVTFSGAGQYVFRFTVTSDEIAHHDDVTIRVLAPLESDTGTILRSVWLDVDGYTVDDLLDVDPNLAYPDFEDLLPGAAPPENWAHYYGTRLAGYLNVPIGGDYTFWIAADETAELWLSPSADPGAIEKIAYLNRAVSPGRWDYRDEQESVPISLAPGRYYIEARHKEYGSNDHLGLAWSGPATNGRELISKGFLSPLRSAPSHDPEIQVVLGQDRVLLWPNDTLRLAGLVYDLNEGPERLSFTWKDVAAVNTLEFSDPHYPATDVVFPGPGIFEIVLEATDGVNVSHDKLVVTVQDPLSPSTGGILREVYTQISGYGVSDLTEASVFPNSPTFRDTLDRFETPVEWADNFGTRLRGYVRVPETGDYTFYISSDDASELWLSTSGSDPADKERIAYTERATGRYNWSRYPTQQSAVIRLEAGVSYYAEALHKESTSSDYLSVGWQRAGGYESGIEVIQGAMLIPFEEAEAMDEAIAINAGEDVSLRWPFESIMIEGTAFDLTPGPLPLSLSWDVTRGSAGVEISTPNALQSEVRFPGPGKYTLQLTATDGQNTRTDKRVVRIFDELAPDTGSVLCEVFKGISGYRVTDLLKAEAYPHAPDVRTQIKSLELAANYDDAFGARVRGYLHPHISGVHRFNISGDDWAEFYLSTDESPENKALVCFTPQAVSHYDWLKYPEYQVSRPIILKKGQKYYLEARLKDNSSRDHLAVAWHTPRTDHYEIIPGANLSPLTPLEDDTAPVISVKGASEITLTVDSEFVDPGILASDNVDGNLTGNVVVEHNIDTSVPGDYAVRYRVVDAAGNESEEIVRTVRVVLADSNEAVYPEDTGTVYPGEPFIEPASAITDMDASRFLIQASFGPSEEAIAEVKRLGYAGWIDQQLAMAPSLHLPELDRYARFAGARGDTTYGMSMEMMPGSIDSGELPMASSEVRDRIYVWWTQAIKAPDQLRQRMAFALSEILVISDRASELSRYPRGTTHYYDLLVGHAFGNYRDLLEDVSLNPMMGIWLTHLRSSKAQPDENYPRELMQLFTIGLTHLNQDGTPKLDGNGNPIPTYDQDVILDLSRALTGWTFGGSQRFYNTPSTGVDSINPMIPFEEEHDRGEKTLLGGKVLPAGQTAMQDLQGSLDNVFGHPNVGPFIVRRLIQRFVTSNPSPGYISRVAGVFNDNGSGVRGDLGAVIKAILLDSEARRPSDDIGAGKVREPMLRLAHLLRSCYREPSSNPPTLGRFVLTDATETYGQSPLGATTVFNFFEPDFSMPGEIADAGLYTPEFQIVTELNAVDVANHLYDGIRAGFYVRGDQVQRLRLDLSALEARADNIDELVDYVESLFIGRPLAEETRNHLTAAAALYEGDSEKIAQSVLQVLVAAPEFAVQQ